MRSLDSLTAADFAALRGNRFRIAPDDSPPGSRAPFSLVFRGGPNPPLPQRIYRVQHAELGAIEIFLVPIASDRYEAVFT